MSFVIILGLHGKMEGFTPNRVSVFEKHSNGTLDGIAVQGEGNRVNLTLVLEPNARIFAGMTESAGAYLAAFPKIARMCDILKRDYARRGYKFEVNISFSGEEGVPPKGADYHSFVEDMVA